MNTDFETLLKNNELLKKYYEKFGTIPGKLMMTSYEDEIFQQLLKDAIEEDIPITNEDVEQAYAGLKIDRAD